MVLDWVLFPGVLIIGLCIVLSWFDGLWSYQQLGVTWEWISV